MSRRYVVQEGDCFSSIASENGFSWDALWNHPDNSDLKSVRKDPSVLLEGDVVHIPDRAFKDVSVPATARHRFILKRTPTMLRLRITERKFPALPDSLPTSSAKVPEPSKNVSSEDPPHKPVCVTPTPRANLAFELIVDGKTITGTTDSDGRIQQPIEPGARNATLILDPGQPDERMISIKLGALDPMDTVAGAKQRLANIGYDCGDRTEEETPDWASALKAFQEHCGIPHSGRLDSATRAKLCELHET